MNVTIMEQRQDVRHVNDGLLERQASEAGAEATMCPVNMAEESDWLLQTREERERVCVCVCEPLLYV